MQEQMPGARQGTSDLQGEEQATERPHTLRGGTLASAIMALLPRAWHVEPSPPRPHCDFVISYVDKCSNNFVFTCKKYYLECLLGEVNSSTYSGCPLSPQDVILKHKEFCKFFGFKCYPSLRFLYTVWKFHKNSVKPRFIVASL